jgi:ketosteroid isomerase-like protein
MIRMTRIFAFVAAVALAVPAASHTSRPRAAAAGQLSPDARTAAATVDMFHAALRRGDTASAAALLATDALIFESGEVERSKAEYAAHHLGADAEFARAVASSVTRRAGYSDGKVAWIASEGRTTGTYEGRPIDALTAETMLLRRTGGKWRIVHIHWSSAKSR